MNRLSNEQRTAVVNCLIEGCSIRSTVRLTGVAKKTVMRLLVECGEFCAQYQDRAFRNLKCQRIQVDEMWSFCYCKQKNVTSDIAEDRVAGDGADVLHFRIAESYYLLRTSYVERHNLSVRMTVRRFTRLTNAFSKKIENHCAAVALGYFAYNFIKINRTLRVTPAMAAGVTTRLWDVCDLVDACGASGQDQQRAA